MIRPGLNQFQLFGHPLACGRLPVAVAGVACVCSMPEVRRYHAEFVALPGAL